jgi:hypothetical protein
MGWCTTARPVKGKNAWLITWEDLGFKHWGLDKPRVVAVLSPLLISCTVQRIVAAIWCAQEDLTLSERMAFGLSTRRCRGMLMKGYEEGFYYGLKPHQYARKVKNLVASETAGLHTLTWTEPEMYRLETVAPLKQKWVLVRPARQDSWSQHRDDAIGKPL